MNIQKSTEKIGLLKYLRYRDEIFTKFNHLLNDNQATRKRLQVIAEKGPAVCLATAVVRDTSCFAKEEKGPQRLQQIKHGLPLPALPLDGTLPYFFGKDGHCCGPWLFEVRVFRHFPAWKCNMVLMSSKFEGRVAETGQQFWNDLIINDQQKCSSWRTWQWLVMLARNSWRNNWRTAAQALWGTDGFHLVCFIGGGSGSTR